MLQSQPIITRLGLSGFKSFADETSLDILPGLTGIVGPNGCGKSNIVEALRWVMGESSARALRGGESDDLIFAGTQARPAKNIAQVTLRLSETEGLAPPPFEKSPELEIQRQAERGQGSTYRINGRVMRARDVQTLFADLSSGARSSSIISQNRVGLLIAARPEERRLLLEEAAGITGLHARRHDAELKLRQTEANLARAEERQLQLLERLEALAHQAKQAQAYRVFSETLRDCTRFLLILAHDQAAQHLEKAADSLQREEKRAASLQEKRAHLASQQKTLDERLAKGQAQVTQTEEKIGERRLRVELAKNSLAHAQTRQAEKNANLAQLETELSRHREEETALRTQCAAAQSELATLDARLEEHDRTLPDLRRTLQDVESKLAETRHDLNKVESRHQEENLRRASAKNECALLAAQEADCAKALHDLKSAFEAAEKALRALPDSDAQATNVEKARLHAQKLTERCERAVVQVQELTLAAELAARSWKEAQERAARLETAQTKLQARYETLLQRRNQLETQRTETQKTLRPPASLDALGEAAELARVRLEHARLHERQTLEEREKYEEAWLLRRAQAEETAQRRTMCLEEVASLEEQLLRCCERENQAEKALNTLVCPPDAVLANRQEALDRLRTETDQAEKNRSALLARYKETRGFNEEAQRFLQTIENAYSRLQSEREGLWAGLGRSSDPTLVAAEPLPKEEACLEALIDCPEDLTKALGAALTDSLEGRVAQDSPTDADRYWRSLASLSQQPPVMPDGTPLSCLYQLLGAPEAASRALMAVYLVETPELGAALQPSLRSGQSLVTREGALWRWDGYVRSEACPSPASARLEQRLKLRALDDRLSSLVRQREEGAHATRSSEEALRESERAYEEAERGFSKLQTALTCEKNNFREFQQSTLLLRERKQRAEENLAELQTLRNALESRLERAREKLGCLVAESAEAENPCATESAAHEARQKALAATQAREACESDAHRSERAHDQAVLHHDNASARLSSLEEALFHLADEERALIAEREQGAVERESLDLTALRTAMNQATEKLTDARQALGPLRQQAASAVSAKSALRSAYEAAVQERKQLEEKKERFAWQSRQHEKNLETAQTALRVAQEKRDALPNEADSEAQLRLLQTGFRREEERRDALSLRLSVLDKEREQAEKQRDLLTLQNENYLERLARLEEIGSRLETRKETMTLPRQERETETLAEQLERDETELATLRACLQTLQSDVASLRRETEQKKEALEICRSEIMENRDKRVRLQERYESAQEAREKLAIDSPLPEDVPDDALSVALPPGANERDLKRLLTQTHAEREALGAVNLCADEEYRQTDLEAVHLANERADLDGAVQRLRSAVTSLNREGRQRLLAVFSEMDSQFQALFSRMFGGGKAHLGLVGSDDPLEAGLEIFAQPPGKKLSTLSLLSGGEQALTALSLIFAAFQCTPAPLCILDEVDAPLDDANVERFCALLRDMTQQTGTRFLVVTHHQLTMAHMDRLFGITMQERGVSRLLSVSLDESISLTTA